MQIKLFSRLEIGKEMQQQRQQVHFNYARVGALKLMEICVEECFSFFLSMVILILLMMMMMMGEKTISAQSPVCLLHANILIFFS